MRQSSNEIQSDKIGIIKNWLEDNQRNIVLIVGIVFIVLISFGLGRLSLVEKDKQPVIIEKGGDNILNQAASVGEVAGSLDEGQGQNELDSKQSSGSAQAIQNQTQTQRQGQIQGSENSLSTGTEQGIIVASKNGKKYHWPWCPWAKKIKPENQVWFKSEAEAQKAGYTACSSFQKLAPAGYKP